MGNNGRAKVTALSKQPNLQSTAWLVGQLATLAMARQANVDSATLEFFAVSLSGFQSEDVRRAIDRLCHTKRQAGETAFPDLPTIEEAVYEEKNKRYRAEREKEEAEYRRQLEMTPQAYITLAEIYQIVREKRAAEGKPMPELLKPGTRATR